MPNPNPGLLEKPFSLAHARRMFAGTDPVKLALLAPLLKHDYGWIEDEFGQALDTNRYTAPVTSGGAPTAFAYNAQRGGAFRGATGTTDNGVAALHYVQTFLDPADKPFFFIQWKVDVITGFSFEIGMSDPKTSEALPGVTDVDTPAVGNGATDLIAVHMDTDQTLTTAALVADGTTGGASKTNIGTYTPTAGAWQTFMIGAQDNRGYVAIWDGDGFVGRFDVAQGPDSGVLVRPYALFRTRNTTTKVVDIRALAIGWERNG